jgi:hypothetical protein
MYDTYIILSVPQKSRTMGLAKKEITDLLRLWALRDVGRSSKGSGIRGKSVGGRCAAPIPARTGGSEEFSCFPQQRLQELGRFWFFIAVS